MKRIESVYREILYSAIEKKETGFTQSAISKKLNLSLSIVNSAIKRLDAIGSVKIKRRGFNLIDIRKLIFYWASARNLEKDIIFKARIEAPVREIERAMPDVVFTAYTAYKLKFNDVPADYSEVYAYADEAQLASVKKRASCFKLSLNDLNSNFFVLKKDKVLSLYSSLPLAQLYVDLWNLKEWYAKEFLDELAKRIGV
jgi:predicted transcriptional regulator